MKSLPLAVMLFFAACESSFSQISATLDHPQCYENVGCPHKDRISEAQIRDLSCQNLWLVRNTIFHQRGYCFQTTRGRAEFDNSRCSASSISELKLSHVEKANVATLKKLERRKGCP
jgi:YARHG domain-containing protein